MDKLQQIILRQGEHQKKLEAKNRRLENRVQHLGRRIDVCQRHNGVLRRALEDVAQIKADRLRKEIEDSMDCIRWYRKQHDL